MNISAFSFVDVSKRAAKLMPNGGSLITLTYLGSERVIPNYNTMGVAKAALEAATRYIARDSGAEEHPRQRHLGRGHAHPVAGRHLGRARPALQVARSSR
jgi:enoyl-[acyl-carrier-protein] reductase (NADH)